MEKSEGETEAPIGEVDESETVTFRVSEIFIGPTEIHTESYEEADVKAEENVELVTFRAFETYPTAPKADSIKEVMENLREENSRNSFIDSLQLEQVTFGRPKSAPGGSSQLKFQEDGSIGLEPHPALPKIGLESVDKDNLLYALTEPVVTVGMHRKLGTVSVEVIEATTKIIEGDRIVTEPYDHRSMSIPFNEILEGGADISKEINKPEDSEESPPLPPLSDLAADFAKEQSKDQFSLIDRSLGLFGKKEPSEDERDESLKASFTEENREEDFATALMEPDRLGKV